MACGHVPPQGAALGQHVGALRVVGHPGHVGADEHEVGIGGTVGGHRDEAREDAGHVLEAVPSADLDDEPGVMRWRRPVGDQVGVVPDGALEPSRRWKWTGPRRRSAPVTNPTVARMALTVGASMSRFLAENGSMDGAMTTSRVPLHPVRHVLLTREHERVGGRDVALEERPRLVGLVVARVAPDVAAPHDPDAGGPQAVDHAGGLGVMEDHDVAGTDQVVISATLASTTRS